MAALSNYMENSLIDFIFRGQALTLAGTFHVGLFTGDPTEAGTGPEIAGANYSRVAIARSLANWAGTQSVGSTTVSTGSGGQTSNNIAITFPTPSATWGTVSHYAIFDAASGGNMIVGGALSNPQVVNVGNTVSITAGSLQITAA